MNNSTEILLISLQEKKLINIDIHCGIAQETTSGTQKKKKSIPP